MDYVIANNAFNRTVDHGTMDYYSHYSLIKDLSPEHSQAIDVLLKTNVVSQRQRGVFLFTDSFDEFQIFDNDVILHIQCQTPKYIHYGEELLRLYAERCEENKKEFSFATIYRNDVIFKDRIQVSRNKYFNIVYRLLEEEAGSYDDVDRIKEGREPEPTKQIRPYVQMYYSGANIFSDSLKTRVTYDLDSFIQFLIGHSKVLHMYNNQNIIISSRRPVTDDNYRFGTWNHAPMSLYDIFQEENSITTDV